MVVLRRKPFKNEDGRTYEFQIGWPSWDPEGRDGVLSVRVEIREGGRYLRSSPEFPVSWLPDINAFVEECRALAPAVGAVTQG